MSKGTEALNKLCDLATSNSDCLNYVIALSGTIKKELDRLEEFEKENQELKAKADKYDELCKHNVMDNQDFGNDLIVAILNQSKRVNDRNKELSEENTKLKKAMEILFGENGAVLLGSDNKHKLHLIDYDLVKYFISKEKYDLLKEVFGNDC